MKLLTKDTDYAARALCVMALKPGEFVSARDISKTQNVPYQFLRRILQKLIQADLVESKEGAGGGVKMIKAPDKVGMMDLIRIFQGEMDLNECIFRDKLCMNAGTCILRCEVGRIKETVSKEFKKVTIKKLLKAFQS